MSSYSLVLATEASEGTRALGEKLFLDALPHAYPVYIFYYPAEMPSSRLEARLRQLGNDTGENLFVNMGSLADPSFSKIVTFFEITSFPAVVVTATADLAAPDGEPGNTYVRFDGPILDDEGAAISHIEKAYLLFLQGEVKRAVSGLHRSKFALIAERIAAVLTRALKTFGGYLSSRDISVSVVEGRFEVKRSTG